uniref:Sema domain-containing protein n=1 Tax=Esox lucius TaxID=8010 RepID=A0A6Q2Z2J0_ESOLU
MVPPERKRWRLWLAALTLTSCLLSISATATPFPKDLEPISIVGWEHSYLYPGFQGLVSDNDTARLGLDFQRMLRINHMLYIAARDHVFAINLTTAGDDFVPQLKLTWRSKDVAKCTVRGKNSDECYNYVKVLVPRNDETLFACGTNAFNPTCRNYKMTTLEQVGEEVVGQARCPFESGQSNVGLFAGGDFYSATMTDFLASDAVIYRSLGDDSPVLRTVKYDSKWLREPHFLHAIEYGNYVYFFLSEIAVEYTTLGKVVFSRVARVCKNDNGGSPRVLERYWTSFLKARLNCSVPGDSFFYFDVLQSLTNVLQINQRPAVMGVFTTQANSIPGSAVCAFYMDDVEKVFNGKFKEQKTSDSAWTPVPEEQVPKPRPGSCAGDGPASAYKSSTSFPDDTLTFIKSYPLMDEAVPSVNDRPCFTRTTSRYKLTRIAVDTSAGPSKDRTVVFLGSEDGRVLKVLSSTHPNASFGSQLLEEIDVYNPSKCNVQGQEDRRILGMELDKDHHALFVAFTSCVIRVPLSRCIEHGACRKSCLSSRDPYCIWLRTGSSDVLATTRNQNSAADSAYGQFSSLSPSINSVLIPPCHDNNTPLGEHVIYLSLTDVLYSSPEGVRRLPDSEKSSPSVHYTLLIACVLVAFFIGAILSGFLVSCYCSHNARRARRLGKDPEASIHPALSLRSLAKLNGLLDGQPKEEKLDMSTPKMYSSFIPNGKDHTPGRHGMSLGDPDLNLSQGEDLSGLPTPDSTPELPIKNMKAFRNQWERNQNCNNAKDSKAPASTGFSLASSRSASGVTQQVFPFSHSLTNGQALGHLPEERKIPNEERSQGASAPQSSCCPQSVVDVAALDELLKHIHEVSASGSRSITVLTSPCAPLPGSSGHHHSHSQGSFRCQPQIPETESAPYYSSSTLPRDSLTRRLDVPPDAASASSSAGATPLQQQSIPERGAVTRHHSQRHSLIKMGNGGAVPRQHSFRQGPPPHQLLTRMNSGGGGAAGCEAHRPLIPSACLTRQHSYSEPPHLQRAAIVRRTASLKPQVPPKPLFLPATSPVNQQGKYDY